MGYFGLDSAAQDAALAPPPAAPPLVPHGYNLLTLFGAEHVDSGVDYSFMLDTVSGCITIVDLGLGETLDWGLRAMMDTSTKIFAYKAPRENA